MEYQYVNGSADGTMRPPAGDFRPLVQENGAIGWKLQQSVAKKLRDARQGD